MDQANHNELIQLLKDALEQSKDTTAFLKKQNEDQQKQIQELTQTIANLNETVEYLKNKLFGASSEKSKSNSTQIGTFQKDSVSIKNERAMSMRNFARKSEKINCTNCEYLKICSQGCYLEEENILCKQETEKMVKLIFENFSLFFNNSSATKGK